MMSKRYTKKQRKPKQRVYTDFSMFTKTEWAKLGITKENADFEEVEYDTEI